MNAIFTRRSVRTFLEKEVENEKVEKILRAGMQAPSGKNQQPWEFIVVKGKENLEKLAQFNPNAKSLLGANLGIIILGNEKRTSLPQYLQQDCGAATQNMLVEVAELGLGAVWYGTMPNEERMEFVSKLYDLPKETKPFAVLGIGYPQQENANHFVDRYDASRVTYIGR